MDSAAAKSYPVAARDPPQEAQLGQAPERRAWWRWPLLAIVAIVFTGRFGWGMYQARHSPWDLAYLIITYDLIMVLCCCLVKEKLLPRDDPAAAPERRRVRIVVWVVMVALAIIIEARVALVVPGLTRKITVLVIFGVGIALSFFFYARSDADAGRQTDENTLHEVSPEQNF